MKPILILAPLSLLLMAAGGDLPADRASEHVVKAGETLGGIATRAKVPRILIAEANGLSEPYTVRIGQRLIIPRTRQHTVKAGETGFTIGYNYGVPWNDIAIANGLEANAPVRRGQRLLIPTVLATPTSANATPAAAAPTFAWPLAGNVRRGFAPRNARNHHDGLDIPAAKGTAVRAAAAGRVLFVGREPQQFGNLVIIDHGNDWHTAYGFLDRATVTTGEQVVSGERIGFVGSTGQAKGNELHFEVRQNSRAVDPARHLPNR